MPFFKKDRQKLNKERRKYLSQVNEGAIFRATERLYLCLYTVEDHAEWAHLREVSRENLQPWEPTWDDDVLELDAFKKRVAFYEDQAKNGRGLYFLIKRQEDNKIVGGISIRYIVGGFEQSCVVGYWCAVPFLRMGYVGEALSSVIDLVFNDINLNRIQASCMKDNTASIKLLEKMGFAHEGTAKEFLNICGKWTDHEIYALTKSMWHKL
tara:strand:+ start:997 stop:1626 length:630 start_codon:yes stop_codon:yes gene_type:complete